MNTPSICFIARLLPQVPGGCKSRSLLLLFYRLVLLSLRRDSVLFLVLSHPRTFGSQTSSTNQFIILTLTSWPKPLYRHGLLKLDSSKHPNLPIYLVKVLSNIPYFHLMCVEKVPWNGIFSNLSTQPSPLPIL